MKFVDIVNKSVK